VPDMPIPGCHNTGMQLNIKLIFAPAKAGCSGTVVITHILPDPAFGDRLCFKMLSSPITRPFIFLMPAFFKRVTMVFNTWTFFGLLKTPAAQGRVAAAFNDDIAGKGAIGTNIRRYNPTGFDTENRDLKH
jgi:hypothetical protein